MKIKILALLGLLSLVGCTTNANRLAIADYEKSERFHKIAFDNAYRIAQEQLFLSTMQYALNADTQTEAARAFMAAWKARSAIEEARLQYLYATAYSKLTVGQYLYDQQGWMNVLFEDIFNTGKTASDAATKADAAAGTKSFWDLIPQDLQNHLKGVPTPPTPTTQPSTGTLAETMKLLGIN